MLSPEESEDPWLLEDTLTSSDTAERDIDPKNLVYFELFILLQDMFIVENLNVSSVFVAEADERCKAIYRIPAQLP